MLSVAVACSYCGRINNLRLEHASFDLTTSARSGRALREKAVCQFPCSACGSKTELVVSTLRKSKGRVIKKREAVEKIEHAKKVAEREDRNTAIALALLAEPGCECAKYAMDGEFAARRGYYDRVDGLASGGATGGLPNAPVHRYACPLSNHRKESA